ncbi:type II toxin-antitoxin system RelE/ParE family toxin [Bradyrhizobium sp.]|uniref:type II toxin-antitoxin system RelE/ParE family toxin n=1 Tax=Bradyrhizobium sp. TaxID=376 RepID=UPI00238386E5|nr:type II toxin-antitoxin system RelE/ParE family toxin [Bradyrhizobium sp.]MDE2377476.1 type II toxin-antitoxin system RelE/ParE family toxin [Bradyrhizobium sp.]
MARILFTQAARADLAEAVRWYDAHAPHVVPQFRDALRAALIRIAENPRQFPPALKTTRRALLRRFPYILVFRETHDAVYVVAVFHTSRDPLIWQRRS